ncbi:FAD-binding oxidoreductase [Streptomyces eurocidicus]|uniref:Delta(24)-sterol reductase n=1 Tax=Streptomyces eurocidicus TaxID=66423 RepID=A0A7W8BCG9_STREU|nr:FAD-binding protein [Streptomyces eurocidicus]MBB5118964.1 delta24-sterol reductase [Streptomyces eurocidicus]MBF6051229.1 FAD-binding protein [Streptomyces eurocidicus]
MPHLLRGAEKFVARRRWLLTVPLLLPASKVFSALQAVRRTLRRTLWGARLHETRVRRLQAAVLAWRAGARDRPLCTARREWQSVSTPRTGSYKRAAHRVTVNLPDVLEVDTARGIVRVGPGVTMGRLTALLNSRGWTLPVVPELESLTAGGLLLGYGVETSSHRHGLFSDNVTSCEVVLGTAERVRASATEHADLFHALPWSRGALGFVTSMELRIVTAPPWVRLDYLPVSGLSGLCRRLADLAGDPRGPRFVEGFVFSPDEGVIVVGDFAERPVRGATNRMGRWHKPWFHEHARKHLDTGSRTEYVPLRQYYHRHSRSLFWAAELLVPFGNHPAFRRTLGWLMRPSIAFLKLTETEGLRRDYQEQVVTQEALVPIHRLAEAVAVLQEVFEVDKVWICPARLRRTDPPGLAGPRGPAGEELFADVGVFYSVPAPVRRGDPWDRRSATRRFEGWVRDNGGFLAPYALSEQTRQEYREMFDCTLYDRVRRAYGAEGVFMDAYDKTAPS